MAYVKMQPYKLNANAKTVTVILDLNNPDPTTWATYADDAVGMTAGSDAWDTFFGHYPCILENGVELGKLKRNNFAQYEDGTGAPITTLGKDVMICFPRRGIKIEYTDSSHLSVSMTDEEDKLGYSYMAHSYKGNACDKFYLGAYKGYCSSNKLYSVSGQTPTVSQAIATFRTWAQARGTGYEQSAFFQLTYRQVMYLLKYKGQNSQATVGNGIVGYASGATTPSYNSPQPTGDTNANGMDYGDTSLVTKHVKLFGIEDFWGNIFEYIDGIWSNANGNIYVADGNYNNSGTNYINANTSVLSASNIGFIKDVNGTNLAGFTNNSTSAGSGTTYFCDYGGVAVNYNRIARYGGYYGWSRDNNGLFSLNLDFQASSTSGGTTIGSRLMYMHVA